MSYVLTKVVHARTRYEGIELSAEDFNLGPRNLKVGPNRGQSWDDFEPYPEPGSLRNNEI